MWPELHCRMSFSGKLRHTVHARCGSDSSVATGCAGTAGKGGAATGVAAAGVVAEAAGVAVDGPGDDDDPAPEVRCFLLFLAGLASMLGPWGSPLFCLHETGQMERYRSVL